MEHDAADKLNIVRHHIPDHLSTHDQVGESFKAHTGLLDKSKGFRKKLLKYGGGCLFVLFSQGVKSGVDGFSLVKVDIRVVEFQGE